MRRHIFLRLLLEEMHSPCADTPKRVPAGLQKSASNPTTEYVLASTRRARYCAACAIQLTCNGLLRSRGGLKHAPGFRRARSFTGFDQVLATDVRPSLPKRTQPRKPHGGAIVGLGTRVGRVEGFGHREAFGELNEPGCNWYEL